MPIAARPRARRQVVQQGRRRAGVDLSGLAAAGPAVETGGVRVVTRAAAVARQHHEAREVAGEAHAAEHPRRERPSLLRRQRRSVRGSDDPRFVRRLARARESQAIREERTRVGQPHRLDERERGQRVGLERAPARGAPDRAGAKLGLVRTRRLRCAEPRSEETGHLRVRAIHAEGLVLQREAEEPREAEGLDRRGRTLEPAPHHLRAHVDAEHGLHRGRARPRLRTPGGESAHEVFAPGDLHRALEEPVIGARHLGRGIDRGPARHAGRPPPGHRVAARPVDEPLPREADREQVDDRGVVPAGQPRRPPPVRAPRGPPVLIEEQAPQVALALARGHIEHGERTLDQLGRGGRQRLCVIAKPRRVHQELAAPVGLRVAAPARIQAAASIRSQTGLTVIEVRRTELADRLRDVRAPRGLARQVPRRIGDVHDAHPRRHRRLGLVQKRAQAFERERGTGRVERGAEVMIAQPALAIRLAVPRPGHQELRAGAGGEQRGHLGDGPVDHLPERIHGDEAIERPGRGDPSARAADRFGERVPHDCTSTGSGRRCTARGAGGPSRGAQIRNAIRVNPSSR